jgi:TetR/AcrR family transcriptional repressor of nem operon
MARHKDYDRHDVLDRAVDVFWQKGYKACSVSDVVNATGLNTASMYKEFGDKDRLFEQALEHYRQQILSPRLNALRDEPNIKGVEGFLQTIINGASAKGYRGCLIMNHLSQKNSISPKAGKILSDFCAETEGLLTTALRNAQASGDIPAQKDPAVLASFVMCCVHGLVLYGRHPNRKGGIPGLYQVIRHALEQ